MATSRLIIFLKAPRPGFVKTRLAAALGPDGACAAYVRLVETLLHRLRDRTDVELRFTPDDAAAEVRSWARPGWLMEPQGRGDLGGRLICAVEKAFHDRCEAVAIIGADCPEVSNGDVDGALEIVASGKADVVLGPAKDGGYWLIALRKPVAGLFTGIAWSTDSVLAETRARAHGLGLTVEEMRTLTDVDTPDDWDSISGRLADLKQEEQSITGRPPGGG